MNLKESIRRILREEIKMPLQLKRRVNNDVLDELIYTVKSLIDSGYDESDAIYDTVRQFIATKQFKLKNDSEQSYWDSYIEVEEPLVDYVKSKLNIQESVLREETEGYKVNLVKKIINTIYDNISFIEESTFNGKPLLIIYFDSDDTAANIESWFDTKISRDIEEWTSGNIVVCPDWTFDWDERKKNADVFINTELIKYDNLGNVVDESVLKEEMGKNQNSQSDILSNLKNQDQEERREYQKFVQTKFNMDYEKGAKEYVKLKNRSFDDVFGDKERMEKFISINFNFDNFSDEDWENYWLMSQHADLYPNAQKSALQTISQYLGKNNDHYRYLYDRISCRETGAQKYGTQNICEKYSLDNIQETIKRVLREEMSPVMRRIYRRADPEKMDKIFGDGLNTMMIRYHQNKHNWTNMNLDKFKSAIVSYVIVDLCIKYSEICFGAEDYYNQVWEFLLNNYSDVMEEKWNEIMSEDINESVLKENKVETLVKEYLNKFGLSKTSEIMGISIKRLIEIAKIPIDSNIAKQILVEMMNNDELKKKYKEFEIHASSNGVFFWETMTNTGHFPGDVVENITVAATPFWDGVKYTPVELDWFTLLNEEGNIVYEISPEAGFYRELKHQTNFESVDELLNWYEEFYLPEVYNMVMNTLLPKMHKLVDYEIKQKR